MSAPRLPRLAELFEVVEAQTPYGGRSLTYERIGSVWIRGGPMPSPAANRSISPQGKAHSAAALKVFATASAASRGSMAASARVSESAPSPPPRNRAANTFVRSRADSVRIRSASPPNPSTPRPAHGLGRKGRAAHGGVRLLAELRRRPVRRRDRRGGAHLGGWPAFPARGDVWTDASNWRCGHWLNGRLHGETRDLIDSLLRRAGVEDVEIGAVLGEVDGYVVDRPMRTRDALEPLLSALGLRLAERDGRIAVVGEEPGVAALIWDVMALSEEGGSVRSERGLESRPATARVRFIDGARDYQTGSVLARTSGNGGGLDLELPAVCSSALAEAAARRALIDGEGEQLKVTLGPVDALRLEPGDVVFVEGRGEPWRVGAEPGAVVVLLDVAGVRVLSPKAERGAPLIWRAGPVGAPGGPGVSELYWTPTGAGDRPWRPAHLKALAASDGGLDLTWIPRARLDGDGWNGEVVASDPLRYRLRVLSGDDLIRTFEVDGASATYAAAMLVADFPDGLPSGVIVAVAQWGEGYGWGEEATLVL